MISLPIPLFVSFITLFLLVQLVIRGTRLYLFWGLLAACALQGLGISLVHHYGVTSIRLALPVTATAIPPLAWLAFRSSLVQPFRLSPDGVHILVPAFTGFCVLFAPTTLDGVVALIFVIYGGAILFAMSRNSDALPLARFDAGHVPVYIWRALALALILSAVSDLLIATAMATGREYLREWIISTFSSFSLLAIAILGLAGNEPVKEEVELVQQPHTDISGDQDLMERLQEALCDNQLYLDPDLTLSRLARRLHVPVKLLSATINRHTGGNVSRYVNGHRIEHACASLKKGVPVTDTIYASGFNTKSNFNREFLRVKGTSPREWLEQNGPGRISKLNTQDPSCR